MSDKGFAATMPYVQSKLIEVKRVPKKGLGVFARKMIPKGTVIERVPVIVMPLQDVFNQTPEPKLAEYVFNWDEDTVAIALGYGSLYNHSYRPNARFDAKSGRTQVFTAIRNIEAGEEITVNYNGPPKSRTKMNFRVAET